MTRRFLMLLTCAAALAAFVPAAHAAKAHKLTDTIQARSLLATNGAFVYTGIVKDKLNGEGALIVRSKPASTAGVLDQVSTVYFKKGSVTIKGTSKSTINSDNSITYVGQGKATAGTGAFKGVKGSIKLSGSAPGDDQPFVTLKVTGSLTY